MSYHQYNNTLSPGAVDYPAPLRPRKSLLNSLRKLNSTISNPSQRPVSSASNEPLSASPISPLSTTQRRPTQSPFFLSNPSRRAPSTPESDWPLFSNPTSPLGANPAPPTRRPNRPNMNAFTVPSNEPPPAYTPSPTEASGPSLNQAAPVYELESPSPPHPGAAQQGAAATTSAPRAEDPYAFLTTFDTTLLIDDSGSMAGRGWREVSEALAHIAPIVTQHDEDGIDIFFLNHSSGNPGAPSEGIAAGGYRAVKRASTITRIFERVLPQGGTPTGIRVHNILKPYLAKLESELSQGRDFKPLNLIVLTDGVPSDDLESVLLATAKKLDKLDAPPYQVGVQFFQVGNEPGAKEALEELDDELSNMVEGGVRDIVDTCTWTGGAGPSEGGVGLTGEGLLKVCMGSLVRRLDRMKPS